MGWLENYVGMRCKSKIEDLAARTGKTEKQVIIEAINAAYQANPPAFVVPPHLKVPALRTPSKVTREDCQ